MQIDVHARLLSAVPTSNGEIAVTFQVKQPSLHYDVGCTYAITEALFQERGRRRRAGARGAVIEREVRSHPGSPAKRHNRPGRPTNKDRIAKYVAEHGSTKERAAKALGIKL